MKYFVELIKVAIIFTNLRSIAADELLDRLKKAKTATLEAIDAIAKRWEIEMYPNFLESCYMSHSAWEVLKLKFEHRILSVASNGFKEDTFVASFMGSSVTAGHDSPFNVSFPILVGSMMAPALEPLSIKMVSRNAAMGNNPCIPYDICVKTFAGSDADIVHWEQSYNCMTNSHESLEQFIRQAIPLPRKPIVVFSASDTPNWGEADCKIKKDPYQLNEKEVKLLKSWKEENPLDIVTLQNFKHVTMTWGSLSDDKDIVKRYKMMGLQLWQHSGYEHYKCLGPYVKTWGCCSASWHPSLLGHELRAAHYSFYWLLILSDAINDLEKQFKENSTIDSLVGIINKRIEHETKYIPEKALYDSKISDNMQCYTNFEPRNEPNSDLTSRVVSGMAKSESEKGWKADVFENFIHRSIFENARKKGYLDIKYMLYGNKEAGPLSLSIAVAKEGSVFICQTPGEWGKLPDKFKNFWEANTKVYVTYDVPEAEKSNFAFNEAKANAVDYVHRTPDTQDICVIVNSPIKAGSHVLTIVPGDDNNIIVSVLLIP